MNRFRSKITLGILMLAPSCLLAQNGSIVKLSLAEALKMAGERSHQIEIARGELKRQRAKNLESLSGFLPKVSLSENYIRSNDPVTVFSLKLKQGIFSEQDFGLTTLNSPDALDNFTTAFQVQQPLLNLDAIYGKSAAHLGVKAQEQGLQRAEQAIVLQVKRSYYGLILSKENLNAIEEGVTAARAHRDQARSAHEQGLVNRADYLAAEVRLAELQEQRVTAEHQVANASDQLKFVIGMEDDRLVVPVDSLDSHSVQERWQDADDSIPQRPDVRALSYGLRAARRGVWMRRAEWVPRVNAFGALEWNASQAFSKDASNWALGLQLQWQLFDGLGILGRSKQMSAEAEVAEVKYRQAKERAKLEVRTARRSLAAAKGRLELAQSAVEQAHESHRITEERFKQGLEKTADLLDKEVALTNAKLRLLRAKHDYLIAASELQFALGVE